MKRLYLQRTGFGRHFRKSDDVTEIDGNRIKRFSLDFVSAFELFGHVPGQHFVEKSLCIRPKGTRAIYLFKSVISIINSSIILHRIWYQFSSSPREVVRYARRPMLPGCLCISPVSSSCCRRCWASCQTKEELSGKKTDSCPTSGRHGI